MEKVNNLNDYENSFELADLQRVLGFPRGSRDIPWRTTGLADDVPVKDSDEQGKIHHEFPLPVPSPCFSFLDNLGKYQGLLRPSLGFRLEWVMITFWGRTMMLSEALSRELKGHE